MNPSKNTERPRLSAIVCGITLLIEPGLLLWRIPIDIPEWLNTLQNPNPNGFEGLQTIGVILLGIMAAFWLFCLFPWLATFQATLLGRTLPPRSFVYRPAAPILLYLWAIALGLFLLLALLAGIAGGNIIAFLGMSLIAAPRIHYYLATRKWLIHITQLPQEDGV